MIFDKDKGCKLWQQYSKSKSIEDRNKLVVFYNSLVKIVIGKLVQSYNRYIEYEDLMSWGVLGLIDAVEKFDIDKGVKFETYAYIRIRGTVIDQLRKLDWLPSGLRRKVKKIEAAYDDLEIQLGRAPEDNEVAEYLNISIPELKKLFEVSYTSNVINFDDAISSTFLRYERSNSDYEPEYRLEEKVIKETLIEAINTLTEKEKIVISLYYNDELTLKEIGAVLKVSESRVSQIHSKVLIKLKTKMKEMMMV